MKGSVMIKELEFPELVKTPEWEGYDYTEILKFLGNRADEFANWFSGQTGGIWGNKFYVYKHDFDKFLDILGISIG